MYSIHCTSEIASFSSMATVTGRIRMACSETSFKSYSFTHQWKINDFEVRLHNPEKLTSPEFCSPPGVEPETRWKMAVFLDNREEVPSGLFARKKNVSVEVVYVGAKRAMAIQKDVWIEAQLRTPLIINMPNNYFKQSVTSFGPKKLSVVPRGLVSAFSTAPSLGLGGLQAPILDNTLCFKHFLSFSDTRGSQSVVFECQIKVWSLDAPVHTNPQSLPCVAPVHKFNLSNIMDQARKDELFTDVTIVAADGKEFKAHKVVLAAQSSFFKTRFESRWTDRIKYASQDRVEMSDVSANIMEAILSYVYTGKVARVHKIAYDTLSIAEEYGLEGLREICEEALSKTLTRDNAIDMLIFADSNNAAGLRQVCIKYISSNAASIRCSEGWKKLKDPEFYQRFGFEILDAVSGQQI